MQYSVALILLFQLQCHCAPANPSGNAVTIVSAFYNLRESFRLIAETAPAGDIPYASAESTYAKHKNMVCVLLPNWKYLEICPLSAHACISH